MLANMEAYLKEFIEKMPSKSGSPSKLKSPTFKFVSFRSLCVAGRDTAINLLLSKDEEA